MAKATDIKPGKALDLDGQVWIVTKTEHVKPGKGGAFVQVKIKGFNPPKQENRSFYW